MKKLYTAKDYLAAFEPWLLEDAGALAGLIEEDTKRAHQAAHRLLEPHSVEGRYPVEVWLMVHPFAAPVQPPRRDRRPFASAVRYPQSRTSPNAQASIE